AAQSVISEMRRLLQLPTADPPLLIDADLRPEVAGDLVNVTMAGEHTVELQPPGVDKALGLARAADVLELAAASTIAFGDMPNDVPMFAWAGHGVAMANAHRELLDVADEVTLSNEADGVAVVLERLYS
ncbi:HAD hydrolase family protein, partial [Streptomyces sp. NPDC048551]|uniref:HAD family hydrolase n=1 Tax=Streptomyces sp. NPDC048551 TaxID=3155758 RepID=UPI0034252DC1